MIALEVDDQIRAEMMGDFMSERSLSPLKTGVATHKLSDVDFSRNCRAGVGVAGLDSHGWECRKSLAHIDSLS